ncbi:hypothetical protein [Legionella spiritensis]|uniref:hypothetical protein n=1 Tax=Legionella spiritensis TaxID=452 RepID=UPI000F6EFEFC|nr:hypothetical protein [Legionella spiritensis]VEG91815.1 Uncharacterised protein [Legionella spiritensis]
MSTSEPVNWLDKRDPYAIQRIVLGKALFTATVLTYVYWFFKPDNFMTFAAPMLVVSFYEVPTVASRRKKDLLTGFIFAATLTGIATFYLMYPFRILFFFYAALFLSGLYFFVAAFFGELKNITMIILATATVVLSYQPPANLQVLYSMCTSAMLSMMTMFVCLHLYPNQSLIIWRRAMQKYIACMEADIEAAIQRQDRRYLSEEIHHLSTVRAVRQLVPKQDLMNTFRIAVYIRNIQFAFDNIYYETKNDDLWRAVQQSFAQLRESMRHFTPCPVTEIVVVSETPLQKYVIRCLHKAIRRWNQLCNTPGH